MPTCNHCKKKFPWRTVVDGKEIDLRKRKYCLDCNPLGERNFWGGKRIAPKGEGGKRLIQKKKFVCTECGKTRIQKTRNKVCTSCRNQAKRHEQRSKALEIKGGKCLICGYNKAQRSLDFHHVNEGTKSFALGDRWDRPWKEIEKELKKCVLLCGNCHGELHEGFFSLI